LSALAPAHRRGLFSNWRRRRWAPRRRRPRSGRPRGGGRR